MRTWRLDGVGRENLKLVELEKPQPRAGEVLVQTQAVSLNYRDKLILEGRYPLAFNFPIVLGSDLAGKIVATGDGVSRVAIGQQVISVYKPEWEEGIPTREAASNSLGGPLAGVLSEYVALPEAAVMPYPEYLTPVQASTIPVAAVTAWVSLFRHGDLKPGQVVVLQGSGGVALFGHQMAKAQGARTIVLSRSEQKHAFLRSLGVDAVIDTKRTPQWSEQVLQLTDGRGANHILELIGGENLSQSISAAAFGGHIALIGFMENAMAPFHLPSTLPQEVKLQGISVGSREDSLRTLAFLEEHRLNPTVEREYSLTELPGALDHLDRGPVGKLVIRLS